MSRIIFFKKNFQAPLTHFLIFGYINFGYVTFILLSLCFFETLIYKGFLCKSYAVTPVTAILPKNIFFIFEMLYT